jgi:DNA-binding NarL/FixJ family response regulator
MDGIDGIARLRQLAPQMAIVILTVFEEDDKVFRAICAGAAGYLLKTSSTEDIASAIRSAAAGGSPINPTIARRVLEMFSKANTASQKDYGLTPREMDILKLLVEGSTIKDAAAQLGIGYYTADEYIRSVYEKLQVRSRGSAIAKAVKEGLV